MAERAISSSGLWIICLAWLLLSSSCVSTSPSRKPTPTSPIESQLSASTVGFATAVSTVLNDRSATPAPSNTYSYETAYSPDHLAEPPVYLVPTDADSALASTDCSGWVSFVVNTVSPLHEAVLQSQRNLPEYNEVYPDGFSLKEGVRPWARAFVLANYLRADYAKSTGFEPVVNAEGLQPGDIAAYEMGRYTNPSDASLSKPKDTGHTFVVIGSPSIVDAKTADYDGGGTLSDRAQKVVAVLAIDSSSVRHFLPDSRQNAQGEFTLPPNPPYSGAKAGGIGTGTLWFALDQDGQVIQRRIGPHDQYTEVLIAAGRMTSIISLSPEVLDDEGDLVVEIFDNSPSQFGGASYGRTPIDVTGKGGIRLVGGGRLTLNGRSDFSGGVTVDSGELVADSEDALGTGNVEIRGGALRLKRAALGDTASLRLSDALQDGAIRLGFSGRDIVQSLQIGDAVYRCGTWGSPESGAMFTDSLFSGPGILHLAAEPIEGCTMKRTN